MNYLYHRPRAFKKDQNGAVLIVVLLFLILITLAGVISIRNSSTDLKLATSDQINTVLLQSSDNVNSNIEQSTNGDLQDPAKKQQYESMAVNVTGLLGYFISDANGIKKNDVVEFCYRPRDQFYSIDNAYIRRGTGTVRNRDTGHCDPTKTEDYNSDRTVSMTQVRVDNLGAEGYKDKKDFSQYNQKVDTSEQGATKTMFQVTSTAALPAYGNVQANKIKECFSSSSVTGRLEKGTVQECLIGLGVASKAVVERSEVFDKSESEYCKYFGVELNPNKSSSCT